MVGCLLCWSFCFFHLSLTLQSRPDVFNVWLLLYTAEVTATQSQKSRSIQLYRNHLIMIIFSMTLDYAPSPDILVVPGCIMHAIVSKECYRDITSCYLLLGCLHSWVSRPDASTHGFCQNAKTKKTSLVFSRFVLRLDEAIKLKKDQC